MVKVITTKAFDEQIVRVCGFRVIVNENFINQKIFYNVQALTYPTDCINELNVFMLMSIVENIDNVNVALRIKKTLDNLKNKYSNDKDDVLLRVEYYGHDFKIYEEVKPFKK